MKPATRTERTTLLAFTTLALLLALSACNYPTATDSSLATQERSLTSSGDNGPSSSGDEEGGVESSDDVPELLPLVCPPYEDSQDDQAFFEVVHNWAWTPPNGPKIELVQTFLFKAKYEPDPGLSFGRLNFGTPGEQTATYKITWPDCFKTDKPVAYDLKFTPTITGTCDQADIEIQYTEKWKSETLLLPCVMGSKVCGEPDGECDEPVKWIMLFGFGPAGTATRHFKLDESYVTSPSSYPLPFLGAGGSGGRTIKLEWLP